MNRFRDEENVGFYDLPIVGSTPAMEAVKRARRKVFWLGLVTLVLCVGYIVS